MKNKMFILALAALSSVAVQAKGWQLTLGPAWRSRVKMETHGTVSVPAGSASSYTFEYDYNPVTDGWSADNVTETKPDPNPHGAGSDELWAISGSFTETMVVSDGGNAGFDTSNERSPLGLKAKFGRDLLEFGDFTLGLEARFAGYWNMRSGFSGMGGSASVMTRQGTDWWLFPGIYPDDRNFDYVQPESDPYLPYREEGAWTPSEIILGQYVHGRLTADLYQIGLGPTVSWHALSWLDAYVSIAALCNIASLDFEVGDSRTSDTKCALGFAGDLGLAAYLTDNIGLYAEVGYEWVDRMDTSIDALSARVDFSSLIVSAGLAFRF